MLNNTVRFEATNNTLSFVSMLSLAKNLHSTTLKPFLLRGIHQLRATKPDAAAGNRTRRRPKSPPLQLLKKAEERSEWWAVDGEMHEIGDHVPPRERFVIPRENIPNKRRKQMREQFMRRTRLVLKESEHDPWCKRYMELYNELRENWERLYWDEGYSNKLAQDHANYESAEDDDEDFSPYRNRRPQMEFTKDHDFGRNRQSDDTLDKVSLIRDKFEYDRERRMREKAFAPMHGGTMANSHDSEGWNRPLNTDRYFSQSERDQEENK